MWIDDDVGASRGFDRISLGKRVSALRTPGGVTEVSSCSMTGAVVALPVISVAPPAICASRGWRGQSAAEVDSYPSALTPRTRSCDRRPLRECAASRNAPLMASSLSTADIIHGPAHEPLFGYAT
jgi:hypothetical protein